MAELQQPETKSIALIHNSALPSILGSLSTYLASSCQTCYCGRPGLTIRILDLADFDFEIPTLGSDGNAVSGDTTTNTPAKRPLSDWQAEITKHSGFILLFPYHIWSHCNLTKTAFSPSIFPKNTHPRATTSKPVLLAGFGKEDLWQPIKHGTGTGEEGWNQRTYSRKAFPMMRDWAVERGIRPIAPQVFGVGANAVECWLEFDCYDDYWRE